MDRHTFLDLIPAYALGALDEAERAEFETLLADDDEAQTLLAEYQSVADALVLSVPVRPAPDHLGDDLRQRLATQKADTPTATTPKRTIMSWRLRWLSAAAVLAVILGLTFALDQLQPKHDYQQRGMALYQQLQETQDVLQVDVSPAEDFAEVAGHMLASRTDNTAVIQVYNLPELRDDQTFQLWLVDSEGQVTSGGLYREVVDGTMYVVLPIDQPLDSYQTFGCSLEPEGGSPYPDQRSGPGVFRVQLGET